MNSVHSTAGPPAATARAPRRPTMPTDPPAAATRPHAPPGVPTGALGRELGGDLPCVVCGYNLRGLSIRSMCPECGTGVRATILSIVDPQARELQPIPHPNAVAAGVVLWAAGAVGAALVSWLPHAADLLRTLGSAIPPQPTVLAVHFGLLVSAAGSLALVRPHRGIPLLHSAGALLATLLYAPLAFTLHRYGLAVGPLGARYFDAWQPSAPAAEWFWLSCALIAAIIMLQRPNARLLVARSLVMRTGRVDRQTMVAMALAACLMAAGMLVGRLVSHSATLLSELARIGGSLLIGLGGLLLTIGLVGALIDCARIAYAIRSPGPSLRDVIRAGNPRPRSRVARFLDPRGGEAGGPD